MTQDINQKFECINKVIEHENLLEYDEKKDEFREVGHFGYAWKVITGLLSWITLQGYHSFDNCKPEKVSVGINKLAQHEDLSIKKKLLLKRITNVFTKSNNQTINEIKNKLNDDPDVKKAENILFFAKEIKKLGVKYTKEEDQDNAAAHFYVSFAKDGAIHEVAKENNENETLVDISLFDDGTLSVYPDTGAAKDFSKSWHSLIKQLPENPSKKPYEIIAEPNFNFLEEKIENSKTEKTELI